MVGSPLFQGCVTTLIPLLYHFPCFGIERSSSGLPAGTFPCPALGTHLHPAQFPDASEAGKPVVSGSEPRLIRACNASLIPLLDHQQPRNPTTWTTTTATTQAIAVTQVFATSQNQTNHRKTQVTKRRKPRWVVHRKINGLGLTHCPAMKQPGRSLPDRCPAVARPLVGLRITGILVMHSHSEQTGCTDPQSGCRLRFAVVICAPPRRCCARRIP